MTNDDTKRDDRLPLAMSAEDRAMTRAVIAGPIYAMLEYHDQDELTSRSGMMEVALDDADALMAASLERERDGSHDGEEG